MEGIAVKLDARDEKDGFIRGGILYSFRDIVS